MYRTLGPMFLIPLLLSFACGREETNIQNESGTVVASDTSSTLTTTCPPLPEIDLESISYCKTLGNGNISKVDLKPSSFVQDPITCEPSSADDGMRATMVEMGYEPCEN